jgi:hypothetical protein
LILIYKTTLPAQRRATIVRFGRKWKPLLPRFFATGRLLSARPKNDIIAGVAVAVGAIVAALAINKRFAPSHAGKSLPIARPHAELVPLRSI